MIAPAPYTPAELATALLAGAAEVLPWVGAAVGAAIGTVFILIGIRKGIGWASLMIAERQYRNGTIVYEDGYGNRDHYDDAGLYDDLKNGRM